jgi:beta-xylosidase
MAKRLFQFFLLICICANAFAQQLVMPGDYPDPSVVKIGDTYWASATTSNWFPAFPLMRSKDLINWEQKGYIFNKIPSWADYYFWAPEISYEKGKVYVYYAAHKKNGNLCVGVASADKPEGPYKDHGPLICQEVGSIDAFPMRDENGKLFLIWKEDANSVGKPTSIWAMQMNESRTALTGDKHELFKNDAAWERNLVEGVSMIKHGGYYYSFYAAAGCCGTGCSYVVGVARSKNLLGPWEKYDQNPIMKNDNKWLCPGHGTPVEKNGRYYFLYHAYDQGTIPFTGRQGILSEFTFTEDGWVRFIEDNATKKRGQPDIQKDNFNGNKLSEKWQWSVFKNINYKIKNGNLELYALPDGAYLGQKIEAGNYDATTSIDVQRSTALAGIGIVGDDKNYVAAFYKNGKVSCVVLKDGKQETVIELPVASKKDLSLVVNVSDSKNISFSYSVNGKKMIRINRNAIDGSYLPPWDRALRVGLLSTGNKKQGAVFTRFELDNK